MVAERQEQFFSGLSWLLIALVLLGTAAAISYFGKTNSTSAVVPTTSKTPRQAKEYTVFYKSGVFGPTNLRIHAGDSVKFENQNFTSIRIVSESINGKLQLTDFDSKSEIAPNQSFTYTFQKSGIFNYHNYKDPSESGTVIVRP